jgi:hypothetical protein
MLPVPAYEVGTKTKRHDSAMLSQLFAAAQGLATGPGLEVPRKSEMCVLVIDCVVIRWKILLYYRHLAQSLYPCQLINPIHFDGTIPDQAFQKIDLSQAICSKRPAG